MRRRIRKDHERFKRIVKGKIREDLKELIGGGYLQGQRGSEKVKVPIKDIDIPQFRYDPHSAGGIASGSPGEEGEEEVGTPIGADEGDLGSEIRPGSGPGTHYPEVEIDIEELAQIIGEELQLPRIEPKGEETEIKEGQSYRDVSITGPETLLRKKKAFRKGLIRSILLQAGKEEDALPFELPTPKAVIKDGVVPIKEDKEYLYPNREERSKAQAVIFFMRDVSGSMTGEKTDIIRQENHLIDIWLQANYDDVKRVYLIHDYNAAEVTEEQFYQLSTGGGTRISSVYKLCLEKINRKYRPDEWNIYPFHFSDGENWAQDSLERCLPLLVDDLLPKVNVFCYGQVSPDRDMPRGHLRALNKVLAEDEKMATSIISDRAGILSSIKDFLGTGR